MNDIFLFILTSLYCSVSHKSPHYCTILQYDIDNLIQCQVFYINLTRNNAVHIQVMLFFLFHFLNYCSFGHRWPSSVTSPRSIHNFLRASIEKIRIAWMSASRSMTLDMVQCTRIKTSSTIILYYVSYSIIYHMRITRYYITIQYSVIIYVWQLSYNKLRPTKSKRYTAVIKWQQLYRKV